MASNDGSVPDVLELAYIDTGFHPEDTGRRLPSEIDLTLRNDNFGDNTFDTVEVFSDRDADVYVHYFEDRSKMPEGTPPLATSLMPGFGFGLALRLPAAGRNQCPVHHDR